MHVPGSAAFNNGDLLLVVSSVSSPAWALYRQLTRIVATRGRMTVIVINDNTRKGQQFKKKADFACLLTDYIVVFVTSTTNDFIPHRR